jgi:xanthine dehydrogenase C subunit
MLAWQDHPHRSSALYRPATLEEARKLKRDHGGKAVYAAGGTLLRTLWENGTAALPEVLIDLRGIEDLTGIRYDGGRLYIGALTDLSACRSSAEIAAVSPALREAAKVIAAPSVRNLATLGGNLACGYGDTLPALLVAEAELAVNGPASVRWVPVAEWLEDRWSGAYDPEKIVAGVRLPAAAAPGEVGRRFEVYRKVGRREAFTPSLVTAALAGTAGEGGVLRGVRIAAGGGSGRPQRLGLAEALLEGRRLSAELLPSLCEAVYEEYAPSGDAFATGAYKAKTAANLIAAELWRLLGDREDGSGQSK